MPTPEQILAGLTRIANGYLPLSVLWHVYLAAIVAAFFALRPLKRTAALSLALPVLSVGVLAWLDDNPFNGTVFVILAMAMVMIAAKMPRGWVTLAIGWPVVAGALMVGFGWVYPHFLQNGSWATYLYAAPLGLVPCPTLSAVVGVSLLWGGFGSRAWCFLLGAAGLFYGVFGWLRLGVAIDAVLIGGAAALLLQASGRRWGTGVVASRS